MGLILSAKCPCGIDDDVFTGSGMDGPGSACLPAWCKSCQRLVSARTEHGPPVCEQCHTPVEVIPLYEPTGLRELVPEQPVRCPRCGKLTLLFGFGGLWD